jgi:hypothetical protein
MRGRRVEIIHRVMHMTLPRSARRFTGVMIMTVLGLAGHTSAASAQDSAKAAKKPAAKTASKTAKAKTPASTPEPDEPVWPVASPDPLPGAMFPAKRIVAFYGNPLSKRMGILWRAGPRLDARQARSRSRGVECRRSDHAGAARRCT